RDPPVHADARRARGALQDVDVVLARQLRERPAAADRILAVGQSPHRTLIEPFDLLYETDLPGFDMPLELERIYGRLGFPKRVIYSNFVSSVDGVVTLGPTASAGSVISGRNQADRFLMGLLRAFADAVLLGAGTLRATPGHHWTPEHIYPDLASVFADLRTDLGRKPRPRLVLLTRSGDIAVSHAAVIGGATIVPPSSGAAIVKDRPPASCAVTEIG